MTTTRETVMVGDTRGGWVVTAVLPAVVGHVEVDAARGTSRVVEGRGVVILAEHQELGGMDTDAEGWAELA